MNFLKINFKLIFDNCFAGLVLDIQCHFKASDEAIGLLQSANIIGYIILPPLYGYLADRYSRKWILAVALFLWSTLTLTATFMDSFNAFLGLRSLTGIGGASHITIAPGLISDLFNQEKRTRFLAIYTIALPIGRFQI